MEELKKLGLSPSASRSATYVFEQIRTCLIECSPFGEVLESTEPTAIPEIELGAVEGSHLRFSRGRGRELSDVLRLGVLEPPPRPVRLTVVASREAVENKGSVLRDLLSSHLCDRETLESLPRGRKALRALGNMAGKDTITTIWTHSVQYRTGFGLPAFEVDRTEPKMLDYDPATGVLTDPAALSRKREQAESQGRTLVALVVVEDEMSKPLHDILMRNFDRKRTIDLNPSSLSRKAGFPSWVNLALSLAQKARAVPWDLVDVPGVDDRTVFLGIDLGHNHRQGRSQVGLTVVDHRGRPINNAVIPCPRNNERIPTEVLTREVPRLLFAWGTESPTQVIVHRDGRFLPGESDDLISALEGVDGTLVAVKKDNLTRFGLDVTEGTFWRVGPHRALIVTNIQSEGRSMARPVEIEIEETNHRTLDEVVAQVFWLSRVCQGSAYHARRLPKTTEWADHIATTGKRVHRKRWTFHYDE
jgi:hypothetical protein